MIVIISWGLTYFPFWNFSLHFRSLPGQGEGWEEVSPLQSWTSSKECHFSDWKKRKKKRRKRIQLHIVVPLFNLWITRSEGTSYWGHCDMQICHSDVDTFRKSVGSTRSARYQNDNCRRLFPFRDRDNPDVLILYISAHFTRATGRLSSCGLWMFQLN